MSKTSIFQVAMRTLVLLAICGMPALAQQTDSIEQRLKSDLVMEQEGKFVIERFSICQLVRPAELGGGATEPFQVKSQAEAPAGGFISRDKFVVLFAETASSLRIDFAENLIAGLTPSQALSALRCRRIKEPIGDVDLEVNLHMTSDGMQVEAVDTATGKKDRQTRTWDQLLGD